MQRNAASRCTPPSWTCRESRPVSLPAEERCNLLHKPDRVDVTQGEVSPHWPSRRPWWTRRESHPVPVDANDRCSLLHEPAGVAGNAPASGVFGGSVDASSHACSAVIRFRSGSPRRQPGCHGQWHNDGKICQTTPMDWGSFAIGLGTASAIFTVVLAVGHVVDQRRRLREAFASVEPPSWKATRKLRVKEMDPLVDESRNTPIK